jgi:HEAT repeat protein
MVREVRVQRTRIEPREKLRKDSALTTDDRKVIDAAAERAYDIFVKSAGNQTLKMAAAMVLAASNHQSQKSAQAYLTELMSGNDTTTSILAAFMLWPVGVEPPDAVIRAGLNSGHRPTKALAATMAGLTGDQRYLVDIRRLLKDPAVEIFPAAAKAIARLGDRESLPALYEGIRALSDEKGEACVFALAHLGGSDVRQRLLTMLPDARGNEWFRIVRVLHKLGDEQATELLRTEAINQPAFDRLTALILIKQGAPEAIDFMREFLEKQLDPNVENLEYKAQVGIALYEAGDIQAKGIVQDVLGISPNFIYARGHTSDQQYKEAAAIQVKARVVDHIGDTGNREFVSLLAAPIQDPNPLVAISACGAAMEIANPEFAARSQEIDQ